MLISLQFDEDEVEEASVVELDDDDELDDTLNVRNLSCLVILITWQYELIETDEQQVHEHRDNQQLFEMLLLYVDDDEDEVVILGEVIDVIDEADDELEDVLADEHYDECHFDIEINDDTMSELIGEHDEDEHDDQDNHQRVVKLMRFEEVDDRDVLVDFFVLDAYLQIDDIDDITVSLLHEF